METSVGDGRWRREVETGGGDGRWRREVETGGGDRCWRREVETGDGDGSETGSVTKKKENTNRRRVSVSASPRTSG